MIAIINAAMMASVAEAKALSTTPSSTGRH